MKKSFTWVATLLAAMLVASGCNGASDEPTSSVEPSSQPSSSEPVSSETTSSESESSSEVISHNYSVKIGSSTTELVANPGNENELMAENLAVTKDAVLEILMDGVKEPEAFAKTDAGNNLYTVDGVIKVHNDATASLYYDLVSHGIWLTGYKDDTPIEDVYSAKIGENVQTLALNDSGEHYATFASVKAGEEIVILKNDEATEFSADPWETNNIETRDSKLYVRQDAANVNIYYKANHQVWLDGYVAPQPAEVYTIKLGEADPITLAKNTDQTKNELYADGLEVTAGMVISVYKDGQALEGAHAKEYAGNNLLNDNGVMKVHNDATNVGFYMEMNPEDKDYLGIWVGGYVAPTPTEVYTVKFGSADAKELKVNPTNEKELYVDGLTVTEGELVTVYLNGEVFEKAFAKPYDGNNLINDTLEGGVKAMKVHNAAENVGLYMEMDPNSQDFGGIWLNGFVAKEAVYTVKFGNGDPIKMVANPTEEKEVYADNLTLVKNEEIAIFKDGEKVANVQAWTGDNNAYIGEDSVLRVHNDATGAGIYYNFVGNGVWVTGYQAPVIPDPVYTLKLGEAEPVTLVKNEGNESEVMVKELAVTKDMVVEIYKDGVKVENAFAKRDTENDHNNLVTEEGVIKVHNDALSADLYFDIESNGIWLTGYEAPVIPDPVYTVKVGEAEAVTLIANPGNEKELMAQKVAVTKGEVVEFFKDGEKVLNVQVWADSEENINNLVLEEGVIKVRSTAQEADFYYNFVDNGVWLTGYNEPAPVDPVYTVKVGEAEAVTLIANPGNEKELMAQKVAVTKGEVVEFYKDGEKILNVQVWADSEESINNLVLDDGVIKVRSTAVEADFYYNFVDNGAWLTGYNEPAPEPITLTINNAPAIEAEHWIVHSWNEAGDTSSVEATLREGTLTATIEANRTGFLVAAYNGETFDWDNLLYKSENIALVEGQVEYRLADYSTETLYYLTGSFNDWGNEGENILLAKDAEDANHYSLAEIELEADAQLKVVSSKGDWYGGADGGNVVVADAGKYKVDFYVEADQGTSHIVLTKEAVGPVEPTVHEASYIKGTQASDCIVKVGEVENAGIKVGSSKASGNMGIKVGAGAKSVSFYAAAWNGKPGDFAVTSSDENVTLSKTSLSLAANSGIANNSPFTFSGSADDYLVTIEFTGEITEELTITITSSSSAPRFVVWGATYLA